MTTPPSSTPMTLASMDLFANTSRARLQAVYSDFSRQKQSNPTAFHANVEWWRKALCASVDKGLQQVSDGATGSKLVLQANRGLLDRLRLERIGKPLAMGAVINDLVTNKSLMTLNEFMASKTSIYDPGWLPTRIASFLVGRPLWWALEQAGIIGDEGILSSSAQPQNETSWWGEYVMVELVEKAANGIMSSQRAGMKGPSDALYTRDGFRRSFSSAFGSSTGLLNETDIRVILKYLERESRVLILENEVIKFVESSAMSDERTITPVDHGILELKSAIYNLQTQIDNVQHKIDECTTKATHALQHKRKGLALNYLKSRKQLEDLLGKRLVSLSTLENTMVSIETAAGDAQLMKTYEASTATLRAILAHPSLHRENIDKTMDALAEANQDAHEIDDAIRIGGDVAMGIEVSEAELEEEWKTLLKDIETEGETAQKLEYPQAPVTQPHVKEAAQPKGPIPSH